MTRLAFAVLPATLLVACSAPETPPRSTTAAEIARLEKQLKEPPKAPAPVLPAPSTSALAFAQQAEEAMRFLDQTLATTTPRRDEQHFESDVEESRRILDQLRAGAATPAEKNVAILLTAMTARDRARHRILLDTPKHTGTEVRDLERASTECLAEAEEWMKVIRGEVEILEVGRCLQESQAAATPPGQG